ncbi:VCBS repeat-containing protein [Variovorax boronicumulans]|uniref:Ig-like domain-containing protein n=1 Tax=Variovorax boronicumulans TaxID=436515 RepID=UPI003396FC7B
MPSEKTQVAIDHPSTTFAAPPAIVGGALDDAGDIQNPIAPGGITDDRQPGFHGQGTPGDIIVIRDNGTEIGTTEVDANGNWTFTPSTDLLEGQHAITIVTRDSNGNEGAPSPAFNFEIDVTPPDASRLNVSGFTDNVGGVTGNVISGGTTDETRPLLSGISNGTPGHTVTVMVKDATGPHELGLATIGENGQWTFQVDTPLATGLNTFMLVERDAAGNETMPTGRYKVTVNIDKPNAPVIDSVSDDVGEPHMLQQGEATNDARPTLAGTAQANHTVKFYDGSTYLGQAVADESGKWSFTPQADLADGAYNITATSTSPLGQTSGASNAWNFVVDTVPPEAPSILTMYDDVGVIGNVTTGGVTDDPKPEFKGKAEANATVIIKDNGVEIDRVQADAAGDWTFTPTTALDSGMHSVTAEVIDMAGNTSESSSSHDFFINRAPSTEDQAIDGQEDESIIGQVKANDMDADALSYAVLSGKGPIHGTLELDSFTGRYVYTPQSNYHGTDSFTVTVSDGHGGTASSIVTVNVNAVADAPLLESTSIGVDVAQHLSGKPITTNAKTQAELEKLVGLNAGALDNFAPPAGSINHPGNVNVMNGDLDTLQCHVSAGSEMVFFWDFSNGEDTAGEITAGANDIVALVVTAPGGEKQVIQITSSEQMGVGVSGKGTYTYSASVSGDFRFDWLVLNGGDTKKDSSLRVTSQVNVGGEFYGSIIDVVLQTSLVDIDGSETLSIRISNVPVGAAFTAGKRNEDGSWTFTQSQLAGLQFLAPASYKGELLKLVVTATATEIDGESTASTTSALNIGGPSLTIDHLGKDSGVATDFVTADGSAGRVMTGSLSSVLTSDMKVQVSVDHGKSWQDAVVNGKNWAFVDIHGHSGDWSVQVRISDGQGYSSAVIEHDVTLAAAPEAPSIMRIPDAEGLYTYTKAQDGSQVLLSLAGTGAKAGDTVHIQWGSTTYDQVLTQLDINSGIATINVPSTVTYSYQGYAKDFAVTAQIIGKDGAIGAVSNPYQVVGTLTTSTVGDTLQKAPVGDVYTGTGFKVTTTGSLSYKAATTTTLAGLTLNDTTQANALFTLDKPANYFTLRLTGIDNAMGAQIQVFDVKGNLIHTENFIGGTDARHTKTFTYTSAELVDIGSFKVISLSPSVTLDAFSQQVVNHVAETRDPNLIEYAPETFYGGTGDDVVSLSVSATTYFNQATAGIHGGSGIDTLKLENYGHVLDLTKVGGKLSSIEVIDITGSYYNTLTLSLAEVLNNGGVDLFYKGDKSRVQMMVKGNADDTLNLSDLLAGGIDQGDWIKKSSVTVQGVAYDSYQHSLLGAELLVQQGVTVKVTNSTLVGAVGTFEAPSDDVVDALPDDDVLSHSTQGYTQGDDTIIAKLGFADRLSGGAGNDTFTNIGTGDTVHGGSGDDTVRINSGDFERVEGGLGIDTLVMDGKAMHIDLTAFGLKIQGIEKFDLGAGGNTLALHASDVLAGGARDMVTADGKVQMLVNGANGDVNLLGGDDSWTQGGNATVSGVTYSVYTNLAGTAELLVEDKVHVTIL